jgi:predicted deacetylase
VTKYIKNEAGAVHSVTDEHFETVLHEETDSGRKYLLHGFEEIDAAEAKKLAPHLFGKPDPAIVYTSKELKEVRDRQEWERELAADEDPEPEPEPEPTPTPTPTPAKK